jgi:long-chain acyl-CoA synthetase
VSTSPSISTTLSIAGGRPLDTVAGMLPPGSRIDDLVSRAARSAPHRIALRTADPQSAAAEVTYAELDASITGCAVALAGLLGRTPAVVAVASLLHPDFARVYYGISRGGHTSAILNPLLPGAALVHILNTSGARLAVLSPRMWREIRPLRAELTALRHLVLTERDDDTDDLPVLGELPFLGEPLVLGELPAAGELDPIGSREPACVLFTSGTTGAPKAVPLTHRNLVVNAAQTADAQQLSEDSVLFNYLPTFHTMHLNAGVHAVATHVLGLGDDATWSIEAADRHRATHYYSLPVRLSRLAVDPRLPRLRLSTVQALLSGGSALPPPTAAALAAHFGVPVVQGYGLAEASPLTHSSRLDDARPGSCGRPLAGTESRIVEVNSRAVLPIGEKGEVQIRGPQMMTGYLGQKSTSEIDAEGWFSTGDIGRFDADGYLYLTDRLKDVFKCDNFLVSPTEIEAVLRRHPAVEDCVVVDQADEFSGAVAYALVVFREPEADPAAVMAFANSSLPYFMQVRHVEPVASVPRSPNGKIRRPDLRQVVAALGRRHVSSPPA